MQEGEHSPVDNARAALCIYHMHRMHERIYLVVCNDFPQLKNTNAPHFAHF